MATIKDLKRWYDAFEHCKTGYCCYQDSGKSKWELKDYVSYYRNVPSYIREK